MRAILARNRGGASLGAALLIFTFALLGVAAGAFAAAEPDAAEVTVEEKLAGLERLPGLFDLYPDPSRGALWTLLPAPAAEAAERGVMAEVLYLEGLLTGLGSNPVGLDRGQMGESRVLRLRRVGDRVLFELPNLRFRSRSGDEAESRAVEESFATSILWAGEIAATAADGRLLVDLAGFLLRDEHAVARSLASAGQGDYVLDIARSVVDLDASLAFPDNIELEAVLTFAAVESGGGSIGGPDGRPVTGLGAEVRATTPDPRAVTVVAHHSFVRLPDDGYEPRAFDPREGFWSVRFLDYAAALDDPLEVAWIARHRLQKSDPDRTSSLVRVPIVYYVDRGAPEPVRSALVDGASWWARAFEEAGFEDAFRVELLPDGAHPLDVRYNVIQWVHRATRGWSYGHGVTDPRTGEIVKGHVSLGSLRVRQDIRIFEGLLGTADTGTGSDRDPVELALARIRQLAAHEVGHTLGLTHNFAASINDRASVMDYPAPLVRVDEAGEMDVSEAYGVGVGAWDRHVIAWGYGEHPPGADETAGQERLVQARIASGLLFISDEDARPAAAAHPLANLWDNGSDPTAELERLLAVRRVALDRYGPGNVAAGRPLSQLQETLAPIYFLHRYQVDAVAKAIGGYEYAYSLRGDGQGGMEPVSADEQRRALAALLAALDTAELDLPPVLLDLLLPRPFGVGPNRELFRGHTDPIFDPLAAAAAAADLVISNLLQPERLARSVDLHRRDGDQPGATEVLDDTVEAVFAKGEGADSRRLELERTVQAVLVQRLLELAADGEAPLSVRARVEAALAELRERLARHEGAASALLSREIDRFLESRQWTPVALPAAPELPPGSPIGGGFACGWSGS